MNSSKSIRRIMLDCKDIMSEPIDNIYYHHDEDNLYKGYAVIIGPKDTPYENGFYFFEFIIPKFFSAIWYFSARAAMLMPKTTIYINYSFIFW